MRILMVFHGVLPAEQGPASTRPGSGGAIRAGNHKRALEAAGHQVIPLTRAQDTLPGDPPGFQDADQLRRMAQAIQPGAILCVQPEEAHALAGIAPLCVDLYAPRLLEAHFQGATAKAAEHTLTALHAADFVLFSNERQRWFNLGLMVLAGMDPALGAVVPLAAPQVAPGKRSRHPEILMGGVAWPWIDPLPGLERAVAHLEKRRKGRIVVLGGQPGVGHGVDAPRLPQSKRLVIEDARLPYHQLLARYSQGWAALDWMQPHFERELALAFRHVDSLGCGLPLITGDFHPLSARVDAAGAGWVGGSLEDALDAVLEGGPELQARSEAARALAGEMAWDRVAAGLLAWAQDPRPREKGAPALGGAAELSVQVGSLLGKLEAAAAAQGRAEREVVQKRQEVEGLSAQVAELTTTIADMARGLEEVAGFKREAIAVMGAQGQGLAREVQGLERLLAEARAELAKKNAELRAGDRDRDQLRGLLAEAELRAQEAELRASGLGARLDALARSIRGGRGSG
ncbi:MAG: hypothetical protein VX899_01910 [Myxococcota bacterium]|nr:hypothetical protein [Myxococcota bacterium]